MCFGSPGGRPVTNAQQEQLRAKLRQLDPAQVCATSNNCCCLSPLVLLASRSQVKKMLLAHVRSCQNKACHTCHKLRERIRQSRQQQQQQQQGLGGSGHPVGSVPAPPGSHVYSMQGSFNPLVGSFSGNNCIGSENPRFHRQRRRTLSSLGRPPIFGHRVQQHARQRWGTRGQFWSGLRRSPLCSKRHARQLGCAPRTGLSANASG